MNAGDWLRSCALKLNDAGVGSAHLDSLLLLEFVLKRDRTHFLSHPEIVISTAQLQQLNGVLTRRVDHEPIAYITKNIEFYGRNFYVDYRVLAPRPESETMIEILKSLLLGQTLLASEDQVVVDVGTGSGCLAITVKLEIPSAKLIATDNSQAALAVARHNARKLGVNVKFYQGDLLRPLFALHLKLYVILANLPYVPDKYKINRAAGHEPKAAIFGGKDGLDLYRQFFVQVASLPHKPKFILTESLPPQHTELAGIAKKSGYTLKKTDGFIQLFTLHPQS